MSSKRLVPVTLVAVLALATTCIGTLIACTRQPTIQAPTVPVSKEAALSFESKIAHLTSRAFQVQLTEQEVTSYVALRLADSLPFENVQVRFLPERVCIEGTLTTPVRAHIALTGTAAANAGRLQVAFNSAGIGRLALPGPLLASLSDSLLETAGINSAVLTFDTVRIDQGRITIQGRVTRAVTLAHPELASTRLLAQAPHSRPAHPVLRGWRTPPAAHSPRPWPF